MSKAILVLLVAVLAVQGIESRPSAEQVGAGSISDLISMLQKLQKMIDDAIQNVKDVSQKIAAKIQDIIKNTDIAGEIEKVVTETMQKVADILAKQGIDVHYLVDCATAEKEDIVKLVKAAGDAAKVCADGTMAAVADLNTKAETLIKDAIATERDVVNRVLTCAQNNKINPLGLALCLNKQTKPINDEITKLTGEVMAIKAEAEKVLPGVAKDLETCLKGIAAPLQKQAEAIVSNFQQCANEHKPTVAPAA